MKNVLLLVGAGQIGMAIARRMGYGMKIIIGDRSIRNASETADIMNKAGFDAIPFEMDITSRQDILSIIAEAHKYGDITRFVNAAGYLRARHP